MIIPSSENYYPRSTINLYRLNQHKEGLDSNFINKYAPVTLEYVKVFKRLDLPVTRRCQNSSHIKVCIHIKK